MFYNSGMRHDKRSLLKWVRRFCYYLSNLHNYFCFRVACSKSSVFVVKYITVIDIVACVGGHTLSDVTCD